MDTNINVIEAHLSTGKTLPLRQTTAKKSGNAFWGIMNQKADGTKYFGMFGVNVAIERTGPIDKIDSIDVDGIGTVKVTHDITPPYVNKKTGKTSPGGKPRVQAEKEFTSDTDGQKWVFEFRATLVNPDVVNIKGSLHRKSGGGGQSGVRIQDTL